MVHLTSKSINNNSLAVTKLVKSKKKFDFANLARSATTPDEDDYIEAGIEHYSEFSGAKTEPVLFPPHSSMIFSKLCLPTNGYLIGNHNSDAILFSPSPIG